MSQSSRKAATEAWVSLNRQSNYEADRLRHSAVVMISEEDFEPEPEAAKSVRSFIRRNMRSAELVDDVVLVGSEFATNVIRHAQTPFTVRLTTNDGFVRLEMYDGSSIPPAVDDLDDDKRGMRIVEEVTTDWGFETTGQGKTVWAEFSREDRPRL